MTVSGPNNAPLTAKMAREQSAVAELSVVRKIGVSTLLFMAYEKIQRASKKGDRYTKVLVPDYVTINKGITTLTDPDKKYVIGAVQAMLSDSYHDYNVVVDDSFDSLTVNW